MATPPYEIPARPGYAILFTAAVPLLLGALLSDWAYSRTEVVQWKNFASWLNAGAVFIMGLALAWTLLALIRAGLTRRRAPLLFVILTAAVFVLGFVNALVHAKDAFAAMPAGLILSLIVFLLSLAAVWAGLGMSIKGARA